MPGGREAGRPGCGAIAKPAAQRTTARAGVGQRGGEAAGRRARGRSRTARAASRLAVVREAGWSTRRAGPGASAAGDQGRGGADFPAGSRLLDLPVSEPAGCSRTRRVADPTVVSRRWRKAGHGRSRDGHSKPARSRRPRRGKPVVRQAGGRALQRRGSQPRATAGAGVLTGAEGVGRLGTVPGHGREGGQQAEQPAAGMARATRRPAVARATTREEWLRRAGRAGPRTGTQGRKPAAEEAGLHEDGTKSWPGAGAQERPERGCGARERGQSRPREASPTPDTEASWRGGRRRRVDWRWWRHERDPAGGPGGQGRPAGGREPAKSGDGVGGRTPSEQRPVEPALGAATRVASEEPCARSADSGEEEVVRGIRAVPLREVERKRARVMQADRPVGRRGARGGGSSTAMAGGARGRSGTQASQHVGERRRAWYLTTAYPVYGHSPGTVLCP